jgi:site-specific DNA-cytosine methylase
MKTKKLASLDLFCGIGGMSRALHEVARPVVYCDKLPEARDVILARMKDGSLPKAAFVDDVRKLRRKKNLKADLVCGGFPCVGFSSSGKREGFENSKTRIYHEFVKTVAKTSPKIVFMENVPGVLKGLPTIHRDFRALGYELAWTLLAACQVGAPHRRNRWFCIAYRTDDIQDIPVPKQCVFQWKRKDMPNRTTNRPYLPMRVALLGNSLVPEAARVAFAYLVTLAKYLDSNGLPNKAKKADADRYPKYGFTIKGRVYETPKTHRLFMPTCARMRIAMDPRLYKSKKPFPNVRHRSGMIVRPVVKERFATPRFSMTQPANHLTRRTMNDLPSQIRFLRDRDRKKYMNPDFVDWMMGYPPGWTHVKKPRE